MATEAEIIASNILASAIEYKRLYDTTKKNEYKVKEQRLRQIAENIKLIVSSTSSSSVSSFNGRTGAVILSSADVTGALGYTPGDMLKSIYDYDNDGVVDSAERTEIIVRNSTGSTLTKGTVVYLSGATGNRPNALRAQANSEATSSKTFGFVVSDILNNADGYVACAGTLHDLDTSAFADGVALWLSPSVAGGWTTTVPSEPNHSVFLGYVARSHPTQGRVVILIQNGYELNELHDVVISSPSNGQILRYNSTNAYWENWTPTYLTAVPTLDQVTTAGNTTSNTIIYSGTTEAIRPSVDSTGALGASNYRWLNVYTRGVNSGANSLDILGTNINLNDNSGNIKLRVFGSTGNVVIQNGGTFTDAGYRLDVQGNTRVNGGNTSADIPFIINNRFQFKGDGALVYGASSAHGRLTWDGSGAYFGGLSGYGVGIGANGVLNHLFINTSGNVGIGTTSPGEKLQVAGNVHISGVGSALYFDTDLSPKSIVQYVNNLYEFHIYNGRGVTSRIIGGNGFVSLGSGTTQMLYLSTSSTRVGIGTTSPTRKLTVIDTTTGAGLAIDSSTQSDNFYIEASKAGSLRFSVYENSDVVYVNSYGRMVFRANQLGGSTGFFGFLGGNLLINTSTDSGYKLNVNGTAFIGGVATLNSDANIAGNVSTPQITARKYYQNPNGVPSNNLGDPTVTEMALFDEQFDNKTAFYPAVYGSSILTFETYNGTTWTDITSTLTDTQKKQLFGGDNNSSITIPYGTVQYQITINNPGPYVYLNALYAYWSGNGHSTQVHIWKKHNSGSWVQHTNSTTTVSSWPGHLYLPFSTIPWHPAGTLGTHYNQIRVVFTPGWNSGFPANGISLYKTQWWGGYPASKRVLYTTNENRGVVFPGDLTATGALTSTGTFTANGTASLTQLTTFGNSASFDNAGGSSAITFKQAGTNRGILGTDASIYGVSTSNIGLYVYGTNDLELSTNNIKRLIVKGGGNVLVGTTTDAGFKLDVNGVVRMQNSASNAVTTGLRLVNSAAASVTAGQGVQLDFANDNGFATSLSSSTIRSITTNTANGGADLLFLNYSGSALTEYMRITRLGNVGIGTTTPGDKLSIVDASNANIFGRITANGTNASAAWVAQNDQVDNVVYRVFGSAVTGSQMGISLARSASLMANLGGSGKFLLGTFSATDFVMGTGNAEKVRIVNSTGNFLIGTTSDNGNKLQVNGTIDGQAFAVNGVNGWTGTIMIATNPPGMQNIDVQGGIIMNVF